MMIGGGGNVESNTGAGFQKGWKVDAVKWEESLPWHARKIGLWWGIANGKH